VIYAQAIDTIDHKRSGEIRRRFLVSTPKMDEDKYAEANMLTKQKYSLPKSAFEQTGISTNEKKEVKAIVKQLRYNLLELTKQIEEYSDEDANNIFNPLGTIVETFLLTKEPLI
jgi:aminopeptidase C